MNYAHCHLLITHLPFFGCTFGLLLVVMGLVQRSRDVERASLWFFVLSGLTAIPTYLTGRPAGALLMRVVPGTSMDLQDQHAEVAVIALVAALVLGLIALVGLFLYRKCNGFSRWFVGLVLCAAVITTAAMAWTATLGGAIRHTEFQERSG